MTNTIKKISNANQTMTFLEKCMNELNYCLAIPIIDDFMCTSDRGMFWNNPEIELDTYINTL